MPDMPYEASGLPKAVVCHTVCEEPLPAVVVE